MSRENVKNLFRKMENDTELKMKYAEMVMEHSKNAEKALTEKIVILGKTSGFVFTNEDLIAARAELLDVVNSGGELSDDDLAEVAGGDAGKKAGFVGISIVTAGIACAAISIKANHDRSGGCKSYIKGL